MRLNRRMQLTGPRDQWPAAERWTFAAFQADVDRGLEDLVGSGGFVDRFATKPKAR